MEELPPRDLVDDDIDTDDNEEWKKWGTTIDSYVPSLCLRIWPWWSKLYYVQEEERLDVEVKRRRRRRRMEMKLKLKGTTQNKARPSEGNEAEAFRGFTDSYSVRQSLQLVKSKTFLQSSSSALTCIVPSVQWKLRVPLLHFEVVLRSSFVLHPSLA
ncbi:hypothetical protein K1719_017351 [Acacia pycnantha]|nr:hypothetical protein K1719_017351 [Acacia pycnantha]